MCDVLGWKRSGYYAWHQNREARQEKADAEEDPARRIRAIHTDSRGAYGACRVTQKLRSQGHAVNRERATRSSIPTADRKPASTSGCNTGLFDR
ncbi:IS3 family transposase [Streptomyces sp. NBC_00365]|uniref:IS3 family transposase n=1 Tax=Streptomyces sp. NBC_00365 TaxID=2975726 RepID=UPI003390269E